MFIHRVIDNSFKIFMIVLGSQYSVHMTDVYYQNEIKNNLLKELIDTIKQKSDKPKL